MNAQKKLKRMKFTVPMTALMLISAKSAAQEFIVDSATWNVILRTELIADDAIVKNTSSELDKDIIFYSNARLGNGAQPGDSTGRRHRAQQIKRNFITIHDDRQPASRETPDGPKYALISAAVQKLDSNQYEFNTDHLYVKYKKLLISVFPAMRRYDDEMLSIDVTYCGPFEMVAAYYDGEAVGSMCRNALTKQLLEMNPTDKIRLFKNMETNEYNIWNGSSLRTYTPAESVKYDNSRTFVMGKTR